MILEYLSVISDLAIIFLLAVQSYVLWKLKDPIISTAQNSELYKKMFSKIDDTFHITEKYPKSLKMAGINNCKHYKDKNHIHSEDCY